MNDLLTGHRDGTVRPGGSGRVAVLLVSLALAACAAWPTVTVLPMAGVDRLERDSGNYVLYLTDGAGTFRVDLPPGRRLLFTLRYGDGRLFDGIGAVRVLDNRTGSAPDRPGAYVTDDGRWRLYVSSLDEALDVTISVTAAAR